MNIFVARFGRNTRADDLVTLFGKFGEVLSAKIIVDRSTGHSKGYAFVEMAVEEEGEKAINALNESTFMDYVIVVKKAHPREQVPIRKLQLVKKSQKGNSVTEPETDTDVGEGNDSPSELIDSDGN